MAGNVAWRLGAPRHRVPRRWRATATLLACAMAMVGCGGDDAGDLPPPASTPPTASPAPSVDPLHQEILDVYHGAIAAQVAAQEAADPAHPDLERYYIERTPALLAIQNTIARHDANGAHYTGDLLVVDVRVTDVDLDATPARATVEACLDDTDYRLTFRADGSPVPDAAVGGRYSVTAGALLGTDDQWYIVESTSHWDEPC